MTSTSSETFNKLTPCNNPDEALGEYEAAFLFALSEPDIKNIAVTGSYGSGKSSVIKSFEKYCSNKNDSRYKFLNISLASFSIETKTPSKKNSNESKHETAEIEKSLLQQIIFKVKSHDLEDSQFSRLKIKRYKLGFLTSHFWTAFFIISFLVSLQFTFKPNYFFFDDSWLFKKEYSWFINFVVLIGALGIVQLIMNWLPRLGLSRLSAGGAEISFNENKGDSILNKYLDELIYFFVATEYNVVVFEDLDRLPSRDILIKLREINQLINNSDEINFKGKNKVIKFIFALGDDLFVNPVDRTKFFDFIIPIIPVVNSSNSHEKLKEAIDKSIKNISFKEGFLEEVTEFIDDMRLLFNIANEFAIYKRSLNNLDLDNTKLLALIIYKNKYPDDFTDLNQKKGIVREIILKKQNLTEALLKKLTLEVKEEKNEESKIESEQSINLGELKRSYLSMYMLRHPSLYQFELNSNRYSFEQVINEENLFDSLISSSTPRFIDYSGTLKKMDAFSVIEKEVHSTLTYKHRKEFISKKANGLTTSIKSKIKELEKQIEDIQSLSLSQLVQKSPTDAFNLTSSNLSGKHKETDISLIKFLIQNGYIDEDYASFMTYFYPGELTASDQQFVLSQLSNTPLEIDYKLDNPQKVFKRVQLDRFKNRSILNLDILTYILSEHPTSDKLKHVLRSIVENETAGKLTLYQWLRADSLSDSLKATAVNAITRQFADYWNDFFQYEKLSISEKNGLIIFLMKHLTQQNIDVINQTNLIQNFLHESIDIFDDLPNLGYDKVEKLFKELQFEFASLANCNDSKLLSVIEKTNTYSISEVNLTKIFSNNSAPSPITLSYTYITQFGNESIKAYIKSSLNEYVEDVLLNLKAIEESESAITSLLNNSSLEKELKTALIENIKFKITDLELLADQNFWWIIVDFNKVDATWGNVAKYLATTGNVVDETLIAFLNNIENIDNLIKTKLIFDNAEHRSIAGKIIDLDKLDDSAYETLVSAIQMKYKDLSDRSISNQKLLILLNAKRFSLSLTNHDLLKAALPEESYILIEQNFEEYTENASNYELTDAEYIDLFNSDSITDSQKAQLINLIAESRYTADVAKAACIFALDKTTEMPFSSDLAQNFFGLKIGFELKVKLFNRYSSIFTTLPIVRKVISKIERLAMLRYQNNRVQIEKTVDNLLLANFLKSNDLINFDDYRKDSSKIELRGKKKMWL